MWPFLITQKGPDGVSNHFVFFASRWDQESARIETRDGRSDTVTNVVISKLCFSQVSWYEKRVNYPCRLNSKKKEKDYAYL